VEVGVTGGVPLEDREVLPVFEALAPLVNEAVGEADSVELALTVVLGVPLPVLVARAQDYVEAARAVGAKTGRILRKHIIPATMAPLMVQQTYIFAVAILAEAVLSFVGVGPPPPRPSLGAIIADGRDTMIEAPWIALSPGVAIAMIVLGLNLLGDGLRDALDPRMRNTVR
jgi:peptide/nickel transport system permease protein